MVSTHMKAVVKTGVGKVALKTTEIPKPGRGQVLVQIYAAAQNPSDCMFSLCLFSKQTDATLEGMKLKRDWPVDSVIAGHDFAGVIQQLGLDVPSESRQIGQRVAGFLNGCGSA